MPSPRMGGATAAGSNDSGLAGQVIEKVDASAQVLAMASSEAITNMSDIKVQLHKEKAHMEEIMEDCSESIVDLDTNIKILESKK